MDPHHREAETSDNAVTTETRALATAVAAAATATTATTTTTSEQSPPMESLQDDRLPDAVGNSSSSRFAQMDTDSAKTPRGEEPPLLPITKPSTSVDVSLTASAVEPPAQSETTPTSDYGYFGLGRIDSGTTTESQADTVSTASNLSSPLHSAGPSSSSLQSTDASRTTGSSADSRELYSRLIRVQNGMGTGAAATRASGRPSSRPENVSPFGSTAARSRPHLGDGPHYPDQSFAALHHQLYTPPYPHRASSPFFSNVSQHSMSPDRSEDYRGLSSPVRTGGNTPVESPGLYSRRGRAADEDIESSQYSVPSLHPTHNAAPKDTHFVRKDVDAKSGHKLINNYEILSELGKGTHGKVKLARPLGAGVNPDARVAIKIVKRFRQNKRLGSHETQEDKVKKEIAVLKKARHPHVVSLIEVIDDPDWKKVYMVLEYVEEGEMKWRRKADKWIVEFERHRVERELEAWKRGEKIDHAIDDAEVNDFNTHKEWRMQEKVRLLAQQKQVAFQNILSRKNSSATVFTDDEQPRDILNNWSLEHGAESEDEVNLDSRRASVIGGPVLPLDDHRAALGLYHHQEAARSSEAFTSFKDPFGSTSDPASPALSTLAAPLIIPSLPEGIERDKLFLRELKEVQRREDLDVFDENDEQFRHVPCLTLHRARECFRDTVLGLEYLHAQNIIHRDIKPANLLWTKEHRVKISDFGVSYLGRRSRSYNNESYGDASDTDNPNDDVELARTVGTPAFYAPELCDPDLFLDGKDNRRMIGSQMDIWALGVTLYCMIFARVPFYHQNSIALFEVIAKQELFVPSKRLRAVRLNKHRDDEPRDRPEDHLEYEAIDDELLDLLKRLLHKDPRKRITIKEIKCHPWVVRGMPDPLAWLEETNPAKYLKEEKIQITDHDVKKAMMPLSLADRFRQLGQRMSSLVRGRDSSKRTSSRNAKSASNSSRSTDPDMIGRRDSMRSAADDSTSAWNVLRSQRSEGPVGEHPLSQSQLASPVHDQQDDYFMQVSAPATVGTTPTQNRPTQPERLASATESVRTLRASNKPSRTDFSQRTPWDFDGASDMDAAATHEAEGSGYSSPLRRHRSAGIARKLSIGLLSKRSSLSISSKSTSSDRLSNQGDSHTTASVVVTPATATARLEPPIHQASPDLYTVSSPSRRPRAVTSPRSPVTGGFDRAFTKTMSQSQRGSRPIWSGPHGSSEDIGNSALGQFDKAASKGQLESAFTGLRISSRARTSFNQQGIDSRPTISAASSSDDVHAEATFSDNSQHPSMPSVISTSSIASTDDAADLQTFTRTQKRGQAAVGLNDALMSTGETVTPHTAKNASSIMQTAGSGEEKILQSIKMSADKKMVKPSSTLEEEDIGYNGDHDADDDSDDEGIVFGGGHR